MLIKANSLIVFLNTFIFFTFTDHLVVGQLKLKKGAPHVLLSNPKQMLRGTIKASRQDQPYYAFLGVRYAKPPKRFQHPEPLVETTNDSNLSVQDAFEFGSSCARWSRFLKKYTGSEDCLFLNVYVPMRDVPDQLPVLLYIHGGAFVDGESDNLGAEFFMDEDVILVVINYRLGALGFLSTGDSVVPGNLGLHDQALAIRWTYDNIQNFGGDKDRITLFGESAGGVSVNLQMLYPKNEELFSRAISQSGTVHSPWGIQNKTSAQKHLRQLSELVGCDNVETKSSTLALVECLNTKTWEELLDAQNKTQKWFPGLSIPFGPVIEAQMSNYDDAKPSFLTQHPDYLIEAGQIMNIPYIIGINEEEGYFIYSEVILKNGKLLHELNNNFHEAAPDLFHYKYHLKNPNDLNTVSSKIHEYYFGEAGEIGSEASSHLINLCSDGSFNIGIQNTAKVLAKTNNHIYTYIFSFKGEHTLVASLMKENKIVVSHADELQYLFNSKRFGSKNGFTKDSESETISKYFVKLWASFANNGTPRQTEWGNRNTTNWIPLVKDKGLHWYELNSNAKLIHSHNKDRHEFWDQLANEHFAKHNFEIKLNKHVEDEILRKTEL